MMEKIICSAIWFEELTDAKIQPININHGIVLCGHRHAHIIHQLVALTGKRCVQPEVGKYTQGFLTSTNKFVNRTDAMIIATNAEQLIQMKYSGELYSEDIY